MDIKYLKIKIVQGHRTIELDNTKYKIIEIFFIPFLCTKFSKLLFILHIQPVSI